jgi:hypothetical protein
MNNLDGKENCEAFVEMLGLGILFPLFMKPTSTYKKKNSYNNEGITNLLNLAFKNYSNLLSLRTHSSYYSITFEKLL